ncbi:MAG: aminotransferase class I/II-fold pyridoxal phosphate-dependent enzyme, partial [Clostridiales bacterium]|nr:aminotransferase class I/II-fold pyridoxal phosphate-dependent enzyme [Clostridiales bacterium]
AYTRNIDYSLLRKYADEVGAVMVVDMAHFAGLVAGGAISGKYNPVPYADLVTTTTHKTLRGPRGGMVLCKQEYAEYVDKGCPHVLGGPLPHVVAAKAVAFREANTDEYKEYAKKVVENANHLAAALVEKGVHVQTGGTDNHIVLVNVAKLGLTGRQAESALRECGLTLNRNTLPGDKFGPWYTSGLRFGTPATTTLGMGKNEMYEIADIIATTLQGITAALDKKGNKSKAKYILDEKIKTNAHEKIRKLLSEYVLYPELDTEFLKKYF